MMKAGSIVSLKVGGPPMVVQDIKPGEQVDMAVCTWFDQEDHLQTGEFSVDELDLFAE